MAHARCNHNHHCHEHCQRNDRMVLELRYTDRKHDIEISTEVQSSENITVYENN